MLDLSRLRVAAEGDTLADLYRAKRYAGYGLNSANQLVTGLVLEPVDSARLDILNEEFAMIGLDATIAMPEGGLVEGELYRVTLVNISTDWETGYVDGYDLKLIHVPEGEARS